MIPRRNKIWLVSVFVVTALVIGGMLLFQRYSPETQSLPIPPEQMNAPPTPQEAGPSPKPPIVESPYAQPVADFITRVTKKPFGIYITLKTSPVQPERFTGYHTGADAEYEDVATDVPVYAFANGKIMLSQIASGYGGVFMMSFELNGSQHTALYGHIRPSSLPKIGRVVSKGEQIALLGTGYSSETDKERKHLHFAVLADSRLDLKGYVQTKSQLSGWVDPLTLFP